MENTIDLNGGVKPKQKKSIWPIAIGIVLAIIAIVVTIVLVVRATRYVNDENYNKIASGMTYSEVVEALDGHAGELEASSSYGGYTIKCYVWEQSGRAISVIFTNDRVTSKGKAGF